MSRALELLLAAVSVVLPRSRRARWREEALAVLLATHGARRLRFTVDTVLKAPLLAWHHRRTDPLPPARRWSAALVGAGLLSTPLFMIGALSLAPVIGEDAAEFLFLGAPLGMLPAVAARSVRGAVHRGGAAGYVGAAALTVFAGTGPMASGAVSVALAMPSVAVIGSVVPGLWLVTVCGAALLRRRGPVALAVLGVVAGGSLAGSLVSLQLSSWAPGLAGFVQPLGLLSFLVLVPSYLGWSLWTGTRLLRGHGELLS